MIQDLVISVTYRARGLTAASKAATMRVSARVIRWASAVLLRPNILIRKGFQRVYP